ncbi:hypothetical protein Syun_019196 [Stephania yunnanensis]|uniref:Uncharacterized protein n=1 Tax=Stephania yunnanensis TaxID=152371 RepID=A0AAP0ITS9_9MAGN
MRCNRHPSDLSSSVGVCASCLRERLFALIAAQARRQQAEEDRRRSDAAAAAHPPPLVFPRSVSPYICRRSDDTSWHNHADHRFYSTPQIGPTYLAKNGKHRKFSILSSLFRSSRSGDRDTDPRISVSDCKPSTSFSSSSSPISSSWFSNLIPGRRKKQSRLCNRDDAEVQACQRPRHRRTRGRGMSPTVVEEEFGDGCDRFPSAASGYSSESSPGWRKSTTAPLPRRRGAAAHSRNVSGLTFCLSPLVRASPMSNWCHKDGAPPGMAFSGEIVRGSNPHLSSAATFCANRSRKLADFGRYNYNL